MVIRDFIDKKLKIIESKDKRWSKEEFQEDYSISIGGKAK